MKELQYPFDAEYILRKKKSLKKELMSNRSDDFLEIRIAILGGSTTNDIKNVLELFLLDYGIRPDFYESDYNRYYEEIMFGNPKLEAFCPDLLFFCTSNRNVMEYPALSDSADEVERKLHSEFTKYESMWERASEVYHCPIIQNNFELPYFRLLGNQDACDFHGRVNFLSRLNLLFYEYAQKHENFYIHDILYESASYGIEKWSDPFYWHMYKYAMCVPAIPYTAFQVANIIKSMYGKNKKVLSLDLDNTLWGGIVGDDGIENVEIGPETPVGQSYSEFQEYLKQHKQLGILLTINSKNENEIALNALERSDNVLHAEDFVAIKANWNPKSQNLLETTEELHLLPESFVFVDDNPAEREIVRIQVPGVAVPEMTNVERFINIIDRSGFFEVTNLSADDIKRNSMYQENICREKAAQYFSDYGEYLCALEMKGTIRAFETMYFSRIAQLTNKSNQFNLTTRRYSQNEIEAVSKSRNYITLYGKLEDKFGDNGVVSAVIGNVEGAELHVDLWVMSCRVLKRDLEYAMMDELVKKCEEKSLVRIFGYYYPTAKNNMVRDFYELQGFVKVKEDQKGVAVWKYELADGYQNKNSVIKVNSQEKYV